MNLTDLNDATFIALETFRKNGQSVITPVWQTPDDGKLYVWTEAKSWKAKRIRNNSRVRLCKSDARGTPQSDWLEAQARVLDDPTAELKQRQRMLAKYGWQYRFFRLMSMLRKSQYVAIEIAQS